MGKPKCLVLPDVFLDHFVYIDDFERFFKELSGRVRVAQELRLGGNAFNFGYHMAKLGGSVTFVTKTSRFLCELVRESVKGLEFDTNFVATNGEASLTIAIETRVNGKHTNFNLNHLGSLERFGPLDFPKSLLNEKFDLVGVFNWTSNELGTELASFVYQSYDAKKILDLVDPQIKKQKVGELLKVAQLVDVVCGNENEVCFVSSACGWSGQGDALDAAMYLARQGFTVALHTHEYSAEVKSSGVTKVDVQKVTPKRLTGAGDAWCAAYSYSLFQEMSAQERLSFANDYAKRYVLSQI
jgi:sugar/nucleoside kinase (ribokinase family)